MQSSPKKSGALPSIGIISFITHSSHLNYGATLHGWAFQQYLKKNLGLDSIIIDYIPKVLSDDNLKYPLLNREKGRTIIKWIAIKINWILGFFSNLCKYRKFAHFNKSKLITSVNTYTYESLKSSKESELSNINTFICESDVIWKLSSLDNLDENFFLSFDAANSKRKIAYAPSLHSTPMEGRLLKTFKHLTSEFYAISSREQAGANYLASILGRNVPFVLDPTLLLDEEDYKCLIQKPSDCKYLLIYNCTVNDIHMVKEAISYAKDNNLTPIELSNYSLNRFIMNHRVIDDAGIEEWLGYFKYAHTICTNSFHGMCFSIIFKKNFYLFQRDNNDYRMRNLVDVFGLIDRLIPTETRIIPKNTSPINFGDVYIRLTELRESSGKFIKTSLCS